MKKLFVIIQRKIFKSWMLRYGIIPPHPASIIKKKCYKKYGFYDKRFKIAADFDLFLRFIFIKKLKFKTFDMNLVKMRTGGASGRNFMSYIISLKENKFSFKKNKIFSSIFLILLKIPSKLLQYISFNQKKLNKDFNHPKKIVDEDTYLEKFKVIKNTNKIINKNFVLSGLNLAFLGYYFNDEIKLYKNLYHWQDGIFSRVFKFSNIEKLPGRDLFKNLKLNGKIKNIIVLGNLTLRTKNYLTEKFNRKIFSYNLPYGTIDKILDSVPKKLPKDS